MTLLYKTVLYNTINYLELLIENQLSHKTPYKHLITHCFVSVQLQKSHTKQNGKKIYQKPLVKHLLKEVNTSLDNFSGLEASSASNCKKKRSNIIQLKCDILKFGTLIKSDKLRGCEDPKTADTYLKEYHRILAEFNDGQFQTCDSTHTNDITFYAKYIKQGLMVLSQIK